MNNIEKVKVFLLDLQDRICSAFEKEDSIGKFQEDFWKHEKIGGGRTRVLQGDVFEQAGVNFSHVAGDSLPVAATQDRPDLIGAAFEAAGVSLVIHPHNPFVPTTHLNVRYFQAIKKNGEVVWWVGGGYDLTPYYGFEEDCIHFHQTAKNACDKVDSTYYPRFKKAADDYFYLKHRQEYRGIDGIFFDDLNDTSFEKCFSFLQSVGNSFIDAYIPIVSKRKSHAFTEKNREFQLYRRGRYVEFNLVYDRGTLFGLQFGGRTESILMSLSPLVAWKYNWTAEFGSLEAQLTDYFLKPREWV